jgi:hypothetical protein
MVTKFPVMTSRVCEKPSSSSISVPIPLRIQVIYTDERVSYTERCKFTAGCRFGLVMGLTVAHRNGCLYFMRPRTEMITCHTYGTPIKSAKEFNFLKSPSVNIYTACSNNQ